MGHKIRAQLGQTNISGNANNATQIGIGNQNNSNNTTHHHYHNSPSSSQSNGSEIILFLVVACFIIAFMSYWLFTYANCISNTIKYSHLLLFFNITAIYNLIKNRDFDAKDFINVFFVFIIGFISFLYSKELFSMREFDELFKFAQNKSFLEYWKMAREWKVYSIYFLLSSLLSLFLLAISLVTTYEFIWYSKGLKKQSDFVCMTIAFFITLFIYYFIIIEPKFLLGFINGIKFIN